MKPKIISQMEIMRNAANTDGEQENALMCYGEFITQNHRDASWDEEDEYWTQLEEHEDEAQNDLADGDNEKRSKC